MTATTPSKERKSAHSELVPERRQEIRQAARRCFSLYGFHQTTLRQIANELGMSVGHIYNYFRSKEEIIEQMVKMQTKQFVEMITQDCGTADESSIRAHMEKVVDAFLDPDSAYLAISFMNEALTNPRIYDLTIWAVREVREQILNMCNKSGNTVPSREVMEIRVIYWRAVLDGVRMSVLFNPHIDREVLKQEAVDRFMQMYRYDHKLMTERQEA